MKGKKSLLNEIGKGFYSLGGVPKLTDKNLVVAVHPYFRSPKYYDDNGSYITRLNDFIQLRNGPVITLEEVDRIGKTARHYLSLNSGENRFFIKTVKGNPYPHEITYEQIVEYFNMLRNEKPIELIGGIFIIIVKIGAVWEK